MQLQACMSSANVHVHVWKTTTDCGKSGFLLSAFVNQKVSVTVKTQPVQKQRTLPHAHSSKCTDQHICVIKWLRLKSLFFFLFSKHFLHNFNYFMATSANLDFFFLFSPMKPGYSFMLLFISTVRYAAQTAHNVAQHCQEGNWLAPEVTVSTLSLHDKPHFIVFLGWKQKLCVQNGRHMQYKNMIFYRNIKKHVLAHSKKNCTAFIQYFIHGKKYKYICTNL